MFENLIIRGPQVAEEYDTLAQLSKEDHVSLAKELEGLDNKWNIIKQNILCEFLPKR